MKLLTNLILLVIMSTAWASGFVFMKIIEDVFTPPHDRGRAGAAGHGRGARVLPGDTSVAAPCIAPVEGHGGAWIARPRVDLDVHGDGRGTHRLGPGDPAGVRGADLRDDLYPLPPSGRKVWWPAWVGAAIGTVGLVLVIGPHRLLDNPSTALGVGFIAGGFFVYGFYCVLAESITEGLSPVPVAA